MKYDLIDKKRQEFLSSQKEILKKLDFKYTINIYSIWNKIKNEILESFENKILLLSKNYAIKKEIGDVSDLRFINISWLRTGLHTNTDLYRIDFYDDKWVANLCECVEYWTPPKLYHILKIYDSNLRQNFEKQSVTKIYELENMIYEAAENLNFLFIILLKSVIGEVIKKILPNESKNLKIYIGEFLDHNDLIFDGEEKN